MSTRLPSPCSFFFGCVATSPSKNGLHSSFPSLTHLIINLAGAMSELGERKGRILQGWQRALTSMEGVLFQHKTASCRYVVYGVLSV